jgi:hypothetical protein
MEENKEIVEELAKICPVWVTDIITVNNLQMISILENSLINEQKHEK